MEAPPLPRRPPFSMEPAASRLRSSCRRRQGEERGSRLEARATRRQLRGLARTEQQRCGGCAPPPPPLFKRPCAPPPPARAILRAPPRLRVRTVAAGRGLVLPGAGLRALGLGF
ncbi:uncharacterized protein LOC144378573 [Ictidomys tridecemlineatus]